MRRTKGVRLLTYAKLARLSANSATVEGSGTDASTNCVIGVIVPVNVLLATNDIPVANAVASVGSRPADVSMPVTVKALTPPVGKA